MLKDAQKINPFLPCDQDLMIAPIGEQHNLILNKFPVQIGHMLLITNEWAPQKGWLNINDWKALEIVNEDTSGLWFFNSAPHAGASQPHRHLQLLSRSKDELTCPRNNWFEELIKIQNCNQSNLTKSMYVIKNENVKM